VSFSLNSAVLSYTVSTTVTKVNITRNKSATLARNPLQEAMQRKLLDLLARRMNEAGIRSLSN